MAEKIFEQFKNAFERDKSTFINDWLVKWDYQVKRKQRKLVADEGEPADFFNYYGVKDFAEWINWLKEPSPNYLGDYVKDLVDLSTENDKKVFKNLGVEINWERYKSNIDFMNAHDFIFPNFYPHPSRFKIKNVLDFGAGFGRQANLYTSKLTDYKFIGMDAVPKSYCLQNQYYHALGKKVNDYIEQENFKIDFSGNVINHIPTWRYDLIPDNSLDLVLCVQVLPELNSTLVKKMILEFNRMLKPGAMFMIRDHGEFWKPAGGVNADEFARENNFVLEFHPHLISEVEIHGVPRIYRKTDPVVAASHTPSAKRKVRQHLEDLDAMLGGRLNKLSKAVRKFREK